MNYDIESLKKLARLSLLRSIAFVALVLVVFLLTIYPVDAFSGILIVLLFSVIFLMLSIQYLQAQKRIWQHIPKFLFLSWYYVSFSVVWIVVLFVLSIVSYFVFDNLLLALAAFVVFIVESIGLYWIYKEKLHFISIKPNHLMIVKKRIITILPEEVAELYYRNDILIFKLKNEKTIFINFLETENAGELRIQIAEWLNHNHLRYEEIIEELIQNSQKTKA